MLNRIVLLSWRRVPTTVTQPLRIVATKKTLLLENYAKKAFSLSLHPRAGRGTPQKPTQLSAGFSRFPSNKRFKPIIPSEGPEHNQEVETPVPAAFDLPGGAGIPSFGQSFTNRFSFDAAVSTVIGLGMGNFILIISINDLKITFVSFN
jgi:hypothetical protein